MARRETAEQLARALGYQGALPDDLTGHALLREVVRAAGVGHAAAAAALSQLGLDALEVLGEGPRTQAQRRLEAWQALKRPSRWTLGVAVAFVVGLLIGALLGLIRLVP